jgi:hypothetical protein
MHPPDVEGEGPVHVLVYTHPEDASLLGSVGAHFAVWHALGGQRLSWLSAMHPVVAEHLEVWHAYSPVLQFFFSLVHPEAEAHP